MTTGAVESTQPSFLEQAHALCAAGNFAAAADLALDRFGDETPPGVALLVRAVAAFHADDLAGAARLVDRAQATEGGDAVYCEAMSVLLAKAGDLHGATFQRKNAGTLAVNEDVKRFLSFLPDFTSVYLGITEKPLMGRGVSAFLAGDFDLAEKCFDQHLYFDPGNRDAYLALAQSRTLREDPWSAVDYLRAAAHRISDDPAILSALGLALAETAALAESLACHRRAEMLAPRDGHIAAMHLLDRMRDPLQDPVDLSRACAQWGERFGISVADKPVAAAEKSRRTIAYIVGSRAMSLAGQALAEVIARHNPRNYRVVGYGLGALSQPYNAPLQKSFDRWQDTAGLEPHTIRAMLKAEGVDLLVFADGLYDPATLAILGSRIAPVQVVWGGLPYGAGLAHIDGVITDAVVDAGIGGCVNHALVLGVPSALVQLPSADAPLGSARGDDGRITFAADCTNWEINASTVEWWAAALAAVPNSALVLKDNALSSPRSVDRLLALFGNFGLTHRIDVVSGQGRAELFADADIVLGPLPMMAPQVALDALWSGTPIICPMGGGRHTREAGSLLAALGFGDSMVATSAESFGALARQWARDEAGRVALRSGIRSTLSTSPALNPQTICTAIEASLDALWQSATVAA